MKLIRCYLTPTNLTPHRPNFHFNSAQFLYKMLQFIFGLKFSGRKQSFGHLNEAEGAGNKQKKTVPKMTMQVQRKKLHFSVLKMLMIRFLWPLRASFSSGSGGFELGAHVLVHFLATCTASLNEEVYELGPMKTWLTGIFHLFWGSLEVLYRMTVKLPVSFRIFTVIRPSSLPVKK